MLYTDSDLLTRDDLAALDPEVLLVADAEGIALDGAGGIIAEAWQECGDELLTRMDAFGGTLCSTDPASYSVGWGGAMGASRSRVFLSQVVASDAYAAKLSLVQRWLQARALMLFYEAAGNRTTADRYTAKAETFATRAKTAWLRLATAGLPIVTSPFPCPGALHERGAAGALGLAGIPGGTALDPASYDVAATWIADDGAESGPSEIANITLQAAQVLRVDISSFAAPATAYASGPANGTLAFKQPTGWHIYAGVAGSGVLYRQISAIPFATKTFTLAESPNFFGTMLEPGQRPDLNLAFLSVLQRA
jgi:hypothetical protein